MNAWLRGLDNPVEQNRMAGARVSIGLLLRYVVFGSLNAATSYGIYCLFLYAGMSYVVASLLALVFGILISFFVQGRYVFLSPLEGRFAKFLLVWTVLYFVNIAIIGGVLSLGVNAYLAGLVALAPTVGLSFLFQRFYIFH